MLNLSASGVGDASGVNGTSGASGVGDASGVNGARGAGDTSGVNGAVVLFCVLCAFDTICTRLFVFALQSAQPDPLEVQRQQEARRRAIARKKAREQMRVRTPDAVDGRRHTEVQTELYLEEITDRVTESDVTTQTDAFLDRPPTPLFIPAKSGKDISTQIKEGDVSVFSFNLCSLLLFAVYLFLVICCELCNVICNDVVNCKILVAYSFF